MTARRRMSDRRLAETFNIECAGLKYTATVGRFADGTVAEIFLNNLALKHGVPLETIRGALLRDAQGRASTPLGVALDAIAEHER